MTKRLLLVLVVTTTAAGGKVAALDTAWTATTEWGGHSELNVRLGLDTHHEGWDVDNLAANTDVKGPGLSLKKARLRCGDFLIGDFSYC